MAAEHGDDTYQAASIPFGRIYSGSREALETARREYHVGTVFESQVHGSDGGCASLWRIQYERDGFEGGWLDYLLLFTQAKSVAEKL